MSTLYRIDEAGNVLVPMQATAYRNLKKLMRVAYEDESMTDQLKRKRFIDSSMANIMMFPLVDVADAFFKANTKYTDALQNFENRVWENVDPRLMNPRLFRKIRGILTRYILALPSLASSC